MVVESQAAKQLAPIAMAITIFAFVILLAISLLLFRLIYRAVKYTRERPKNTTQAAGSTKEDES